MVPRNDSGMSHSGLQPKGDYDPQKTLVPSANTKSQSHSGLQPKGDYDQDLWSVFDQVDFGGPIADFSRKAIMTVSPTNPANARVATSPIADFSRKAIMTFHSQSGT